MNWFVSFSTFNSQSCCFPSKIETLVKEHDYVDEEKNNNTNDNEASKYYY